MMNNTARALSEGSMCAASNGTSCEIGATGADSIPTGKCEGGASNGRSMEPLQKNASNILNHAIRHSQTLKPGLIRGTKRQIHHTTSKATPPCKDAFQSASIQPSANVLSL